jgi:hypothetical protein
LIVNLHNQETDGEEELEEICFFDLRNDARRARFDLLVGLGCRHLLGRHPLFILRSTLLLSVFQGSRAKRVDES